MLDAFRKTPLPITLAILSFISPTELSLVVGDLRLSRIASCSCSSSRSRCTGWRCGRTAG